MIEPNAIGTQPLRLGVGESDCDRCQMLEATLDQCERASLLAFFITGSPIVKDVVFLSKIVKKLDNF